MPNYKVSSRVIAFVLLAIVLVLAALNLVGLAAFNDAAMEAMAPGDPTPKRWRLVAIQLLVIAIVTGVLAFDRLRRGDERASIFAPVSAGLTALGIWAAARMTGIHGAFQLPIVFSLAVAGVAGWSVYRDRQSAGGPRYVTGEATSVWIAALLQAGAYFFLMALGGGKTSPELPLRAILLATPQWIVAWRFGASGRLSGWDAGGATALGVLGIGTIVLITVFPVAYVGFLGPALLRSFWGIAFYAGLGLATWLFLRAGASLRGRLGAPSRDRTLAILAGVLAIPLLVTLSYLLRGLLP